MPLQQRNFAFTSEFTSDIQLLPGKENLLSDILSRSIMAIFTNLYKKLTSSIKREQKLDLTIQTLQKNFQHFFD